MHGVIRIWVRRPSPSLGPEGCVDARARGRGRERKMKQRM